MMLAIIFILMHATFDTCHACLRTATQPSIFSRPVARDNIAGDWCNTVSEGETYCCGFGAQASCIARGLDYSGPDTPCEVRLVTGDDGTISCEGLSNSSGNLDNCDCASERLLYGRRGRVCA